MEQDPVEDKDPRMRMNMLTSESLWCYKAKVTPNLSFPTVTGADIGIYKH